MTKALLLAALMPAYAGQAEPEKKDVKAQIQHHEEMAAAHQKAADCLKAGKPPKECNKEAMKACPMMKGGGVGHCPFMEGKSGMMHKDGMMKKSRDDKKPADGD